MTGSPALERAIVWAHDAFVADGQENVALDPVRVPIWQRGKESAEIVTPAPRRLAVLGLGGTVATPPGGLTAEVVAVSSFDELAKLGTVGAREDRPLRPRPTRPTSPTPPPATGSRSPTEPKGRRARRRSARSPRWCARWPPPASARRTPARCTTVPDRRSRPPRCPSRTPQLLARLAARGPVTVHLVLEDGPRPDAPSFNVLAELRGRERPEEIVVIGAHIDSWDVGEGAQDDGAGCAIVMESLATLRRLGLVPRRTIRAVLYTSEEEGAQGGKTYAEAHAKELPHHVAAFETDIGAGTPLGFRIDAGPEAVAEARELVTLLAPLGATLDRHGVLGRRHQRHAPGRRAAPGPLLRPDALLRRPPLGRRHAGEDRSGGARPQRRGDGDDGLRAWPIARRAGRSHRRPRPSTSRDAVMTTAAASDAVHARAASRLAALDWMRGLVMVLMAIDHSSDAFNAGRLFTDAAFMWHPGAPLPAAQFLTRWITHLCAPTFLFLAGTSLAFTVSRQEASGDRPVGDRSLHLRARRGDRRLRALDLVHW